MMSKLLEHVRFEGRRSSAVTRVRTGKPAQHCSLQSRAVRRHEIVLQADERALLTAVFGHAGLDIADFRTTPLKRRMHAVLRALRCDTVGQSIERITSNDAAAQRALATLVIGHTLPFRDTAVFQHLRDAVLPELGMAPRVWSIGCSRGLELLSVALLLKQRGASGVKLRGSDCRAPGPWLDSAVARDFLDSIPRDFADLEPLASPAWICQQMAAIDWRVEDLFATRERGNWNLILCRNVAIYLEPAAADRLWQIVAAALQPGGYLITGKAEHPGVLGAFRRVAHCIYQRQHTTASDRGRV